MCNNTLINNPRRIRVPNLTQALGTRHNVPIYVPPTPVVRGVGANSVPPNPLPRAPTYPSSTGVQRVKLTPEEPMLLINNITRF